MPDKIERYGICDSKAGKIVNGSFVNVPETFPFSWDGVMTLEVDLVREPYELRLQAEGYGPVRVTLPASSGYWIVCQFAGKVEMIL
jgi:hypothetical protein